MTGEDESWAEYYPAEVVVALFGSGRSIRWRGVMQDVVIWSQPSIFAPTETTSLVEAMQRVIEPMPPDIDVKEDEVAILDREGKTIERVVPVGWFSAAFTALPYCAATFYRITGPGEKLRAAEGRFVHEIVGPIDDPLNFFKGKIRVADGFAMPADASFSVQIALAGLHTFKNRFPWAQMGHVHTLLDILGDATVAHGVRVRADVAFGLGFRDDGIDFIGPLADRFPLPIATLMRTRQLESPSDDSMVH